MLDNEKIKLMTQLAIFEKKEGKEVTEINKYYKSDYVSKRIISAGIRYTLCFILIVLIYFTLRIDSILMSLNLAVATHTVKMLLFVYFAIMALVMLIAYIHYSMKYDKMHRSTLFYEAKLEKLLKIEGADPATFTHTADMATANVSAPSDVKGAGAPATAKEASVPSTQNEIQVIQVKSNSTRDEARAAAEAVKPDSHDGDGEWLDEDLDESDEATAAGSDSEGEWLDEDLDDSDEATADGSSEATADGSDDGEWLDEDLDDSDDATASESDGDGEWLDEDIDDEDPLGTEKKESDEWLDSDYEPDDEDNKK